MATASTFSSKTSIRDNREVDRVLPIGKTAYWLSGSLAIVATIAAAGTALVRRFRRHSE